MRRDLENQIRGILKTFGLKLGQVGGRQFAARLSEVVAAEPALASVIEPLLAVREAVAERIAALETRLVADAGANPTCRLLMTVPGVGAVTALAFVSTLDTPERFAKSSSVGAYLGLTPRRYQSGAVDWAGRICKCGDGMMRSLLYTAANVLLTRVRRWCPLKAWGMRLAKRIGARKAKVAVARKLAAILYRMWMQNAPFRWTTKEVTA
jgi:transposase